MYLQNIININSPEWASYSNGNYNVFINLLDGTKIRLNNEDKLVPEFAESIDLNITNKCNIGCPYCYQGCTKDGRHADLQTWDAFIDSLPKYTELAINGNDLDHPLLEGFLMELRKKEVIANITVHQDVFTDPVLAGKLDTWFRLRLINGVGVSVNKPTENLIRIIDFLKINTLVLHVIAGVFDERQHNMLRGNNLKLLILGYKDMNRGYAYRINKKNCVTDNIAWLRNNIGNMINDYAAIGFDTLAVEQLGLNKESKYYMGDDGEYTFFVDLVSGEYAKSSTSIDRKKMMPGMTAQEMFQNIRRQHG